MKNKGLWIALGVISVVGIGTWFGVRYYNSMQANKGNQTAGTQTAGIQTAGTQTAGKVVSNKNNTQLSQ